MLAFDGVTAIETSDAACGVTVNVVVPEMLPATALMMDVPAARPDANPEAEMFALLVSAEYQVTDPVIFCVVPSEYVPVAVNC